uniref:P-type ATPase N-terminal domain-containing protein n=1 Tax=Chromera velia CCMP2878 TaxID=1169474 RepID=A0A0G4I4Q1_9ALVE|eukprot:Cvel_10965.t1-p1 / transcript=Cvel_10965.t1 / gene=Cvel_10965 / organism=Chromera_velia_CCMP2878 / gene_product=Phospholipid-transporting ATPase 6, putative / transcript_product=Phospholipid-transporting ATPase 6, putative / location=Cvel_scaffold674:45510-70097(-) / protein_length=4032 / sequence_SO=supercontig / SO=protein_coding / is_pseudo=false
MPCPPRCCRRRAPRRAPPKSNDEPLKISAGEGPLESKTNTEYKIHEWHNKIKTSKYTIWTFIPYNLFEQFHNFCHEVLLTQHSFSSDQCQEGTTPFNPKYRFVVSFLCVVAANCYFLAMAFLQTIPEISDTNGLPLYLIPLSVVLTISALKSAVEDRKRSKSDREENLRTVLLLDEQEGKFRDALWEELLPGDVVKVREDQFFPADLVVLSCSDEFGICYVETKNLDGETNLKHKASVPELSQMIKNDDDAAGFRATIHFEVPNESLYSFSGGVVLEEGGGDGDEDRAAERLPPRGRGRDASAVRAKKRRDSSSPSVSSQGSRSGSDGAESRMERGEGKKRKGVSGEKGKKKWGTGRGTGRATRGQSQSLVLHQQNQRDRGGRGGGGEKEKEKEKHTIVRRFQTLPPDLLKKYGVSGALQSASGMPRAEVPLGPPQFLLRGSSLRNTEYVYAVVTYTGHQTRIFRNTSTQVFGAQFLLFGYFVPIGLIVTMEIVKFWQAMFVNVDEQMADPETGGKACANTSNLMEELGNATETPLLLPADANPPLNGNIQFGAPMPKLMSNLGIGVGTRTPSEEVIPPRPQTATPNLSAGTGTNWPDREREREGSSGPSRSGAGSRNQQDLPQSVHGGRGGRGGWTPPLPRAAADEDVERGLVSRSSVGVDWDERGDGGEAGEGEGRGGVREEEEELEEEGGEVDASSPERYVDFDAEEFHQSLLNTRGGGNFLNKSRDFLLVLALCHTVLIKEEGKSDGGGSAETEREDLAAKATPLSGVEEEREGKRQVRRRSSEGGRVKLSVSVSGSDGRGRADPPSAQWERERERGGYVDVPRAGDGDGEGVRVHVWDDPLERPRTASSGSRESSRLMLLEKGRRDTTQPRDRDRDRDKESKHRGQFFHSIEDEDLEEQQEQQNGGGIISGATTSRRVSISAGALGLGSPDMLCKSEPPSLPHTARQPAVRAQRLDDASFDVHAASPGGAFREGEGGEEWGTHAGAPAAGGGGGGGGLAAWVDGRIRSSIDRSIGVEPVGENDPRQQSFSAGRGRRGLHNDRQGVDVMEEREVFGARSARVLRDADRERGREREAPAKGSVTIAWHEDALVSSGSKNESVCMGAGVYRHSREEEAQEEGEQAQEREKDAYEGRELSQWRTSHASAPPPPVPVPPDPPNLHEGRSFAVLSMASDHDCSLGELQDSAQIVGAGGGLPVGGGGQTADACKDIGGPHRQETPTKPNTGTNTNTEILPSASTPCALISSDASCRGECLGRGATSCSPLRDGVGYESEKEREKERDVSVSCKDSQQESEEEALQNETEPLDPLRPSSPEVEGVSTKCLSGKAHMGGENRSRPQEPPTNFDTHSRNVSARSHRESPPVTFRQENENENKHEDPGGVWKQHKNQTGGDREHSLSDEQANSDSDRPPFNIGRGSSGTPVDGLTAPDPAIPTPPTQSPRLSPPRVPGTAPQADRLIPPRTRDTRAGAHADSETVPEHNQTPNVSLSPLETESETETNATTQTPKHSHAQLLLHSQGDHGAPPPAFFQSVSIPGAADSCSVTDSESDGDLESHHHQHRKAKEWTDSCTNLLGVGSHPGDRFLREGSSPCRRVGDVGEASNDHAGAPNHRARPRDRGTSTQRRCSSRKGQKEWRRAEREQAQPHHHPGLHEDEDEDPPLPFRTRSFSLSLDGFSSRSPSPSASPRGRRRRNNHNTHKQKQITPSHNAKGASKSKPSARKDRETEGEPEESPAAGGMGRGMEATDIYKKMSASSDGPEKSPPHPNRGVISPSPPLSHHGGSSSSPSPSCSSSQPLKPCRHAQQPVWSSPPAASCSVSGWGSCRDPETLSQAAPSVSAPSRAASTMPLTQSGSRAASTRVHPQAHTRRSHSGLRGSVVRRSPCGVRSGGSSWRAFPVGARRGGVGRGDEGGEVKEGELEEESQWGGPGGSEASSARVQLPPGGGSGGGGGGGQKHVTSPPPGFSQQQQKCFTALWSAGGLQVPRGRDRDPGGVGRGDWERQRERERGSFGSGGSGVGHAIGGLCEETSVCAETFEEGGGGREVPEVVGRPASAAESSSAVSGLVRRFSRESGGNESKSLHGESALSAGGQTDHTHAQQTLPPICVEDPGREAHLNQVRQMHWEMEEQEEEMRRRRGASGGGANEWGSLGRDANSDRYSYPHHHHQQQQQRGKRLSFSSVQRDSADSRADDVEFLHPAAGEGTGTVILQSPYHGREGNEMAVYRDRGERDTDRVGGGAGSFEDLQTAAGWQHRQLSGSSNEAGSEDATDDLWGCSPASRGIDSSADIPFIPAETGVEFYCRPDLNTLQVRLTADVTKRLFGFLQSDEMAAESEEKPGSRRSRGRDSRTPPDSEERERKERKRGWGEQEGRGGHAKVQKTPVLSFKVFDVVEFDNDRKRMSVVLSDMCGKVRVLVKGADNSMLAAAAAGQDEMIGSIQSQLLALARVGLRTLVLGYRDLSGSEYAKWHRIFASACAEVGEAKTRAMQAAIAAIERNLTLVGCTGIEDKLQDDVPAVIADLKDAGVKLWVLTGDKMETAISIGHSCNILTDSGFNAVIDGGTPKEVAAQLEAFTQYCEAAELFKTVLQKSPQAAECGFDKGEDDIFTNVDEDEALEPQSQQQPQPNSVSAASETVSAGGGTGRGPAKNTATAHAHHNGMNPPVQQLLADGRTASSHNFPPSVVASSPRDRNRDRTAPSEHSGTAHPSHVPRIPLNLNLSQAFATVTQGADARRAKQVPPLHPPTVPSPHANHRTPKLFPADFQALPKKSERENENSEGEGGEPVPEVEDQTHQVLLAGESETAAMEVEETAEEEDTEAIADPSSDHRDHPTKLSSQRGDGPNSSSHRVFVPLALYARDPIVEAAESPRLGVQEHREGEEEDDGVVENIRHEEDGGGSQEVVEEPPTMTTPPTNRVVQEHPTFMMPQQQQPAPVAVSSGSTPSPSPSPSPPPGGPPPSDLERATSSPSPPASHSSALSAPRVPPGGRERGGGAVVFRSPPASADVLPHFVTTHGRVENATRHDTESSHEHDVPVDNRRSLGGDGYLRSTSHDRERARERDEQEQSRWAPANLFALWRRREKDRGDRDRDSRERERGRTTGEGVAPTDGLLALPPSSRPRRHSHSAGGRYTNQTQQQQQRGHNGISPPPPRGHKPHNANPRVIRARLFLSKSGEGDAELEVEVHPQLRRSSNPAVVGPVHGGEGGAPMGMRHHPHHLRPGGLSRSSPSHGQQKQKAYSRPREEIQTHRDSLLQQGRGGGGPVGASVAADGGHAVGDQRPISAPNRSSDVTGEREGGGEKERETGESRRVSVMSTPDGSVHHRNNNSNGERFVARTRPSSRERAHNLNHAMGRSEMIGAGPRESPHNDPPALDGSLRSSFVFERTLSGSSLPRRRGMWGRPSRDPMERERERDSRDRLRVPSRPSRLGESQSAGRTRTERDRERDRAFVPPLIASPATFAQIKEQLKQHAAGLIASKKEKPRDKEKERDPTLSQSSAPGPGPIPPPAQQHQHQQSPLPPSAPLPSGSSIGASDTAAAQTVGGEGGEREIEAAAGESRLTSRLTSREKAHTPPLPQLVFPVPVQISPHSHRSISKAAEGEREGGEAPAVIVKTKTTGLSERQQAGFKSENDEDGAMMKELDGTGKASESGGGWVDLKGYSHFAVTISGEALHVVLRSRRLRRSFFRLTSLASTVSDGANDVGMILAAHLGVGIAGKEGLQAVRASDFGICQFKYVSQSAYSGSDPYNPYFKQVYNLLFTSLPIIIWAVFDRQLPYSLLSRVPFLYNRPPVDVWPFNAPIGKWSMSHQCGVPFFVLWFAYALWAAAVGFAVPHFGLHGGLYGASTHAEGVCPGSMKMIGVASYLTIVMIANVAVVPLVNTWFLFTHGAIWIGFFLFFCVWAIVQNISPEIEGSFLPLTSMPVFWLTVIVGVLLGVLPHFLVWFWQVSFKPSQIDTVKELLSMGRFDALMKKQKDQPGVAVLVPVDHPEEYLGFAFGFSPGAQKVAREAVIQQQQRLVEETERQRQRGTRRKTTQQRQQH